MKVRNSFVANSSSTSFLLADLRIANKDKELKTKITIDVNLSNYIGNTISTLEELEDIKDAWYNIEENYDAMKEVIRKGGVIHILDVCDDSGGSDIERYLCNKGINKVEPIPGIEILYGEGGY